MLKIFAKYAGKFCIEINKRLKMKKILSVANALIVLSFLSLFHSEAAAKSTQENVETGSSMEKAILYYVNQYRAQKGLPALKMNKQMSREAEIHSREMAAHKISFGHKDFNKRIKRLFAEIKDCRGGAENVAYNYKGAQDVVKNWMTSLGHRRNILGHYNLTGIGLARDSKGKIYFTQIFLKTDNPAYKH